MSLLHYTSSHRLLLESLGAKERRQSQGLILVSMQKIISISRTTKGRGEENFSGVATNFNLTVFAGGVGIATKGS